MNSQPFYGYDNMSYGPMNSHPFYGYGPMNSQPFYGYGNMSCGPMVGSGGPMVGIKGSMVCKIEVVKEEVIRYNCYSFQRGRDEEEINKRKHKA